VACGDGDNDEVGDAAKMMMMLMAMLVLTAGIECQISSA
jgi:hypothetical protein